MILDTNHIRRELSLRPVVVLPDVETHCLDVAPLAVHLRDAGLDAYEVLEVGHLDEVLEVLGLGPIANERPVVSDIGVRVEIDTEWSLRALSERSPRARAERRLKKLPPMKHHDLLGPRVRAPRRRSGRRRRKECWRGSSR